MRNNYFKIRNYRRADFAGYVQLNLETNRLDRSGRSISSQRLAEDLGHPNFHPESDLFVAVRDNSIIGYASAFLEAPIQRAILECMIHPHHRNKGIATELVRHTIRHVETSGIKMAQICIPQLNMAAKTYVTRLGFKFIRHFYELKLDLNHIRLPNFEPTEYIIRSLSADEADKLTHIQNRAFAGSWGFNPNTPDEIAYRINLSSCSPKNILMVYLENQPIGYCWTRIFVEEDAVSGNKKGEIHMLGVDPDYRGKGIGRNVLLAGLADLKTQGVTDVELSADGEDRVARGLYESVGFEECSRSEWYEKTLT